MIRIFYHLVAFTIFMIQAQKSLYKYFQYPVVIQESWANVITIKKPDLQVCIDGSYDFGKASEYGYDSYSKFLAGMIPNSTRPTWKGIYQNSTYQEITNVLHERDFRKILLNQPSKLSYKIDKGFCLQTNGIDEELKITTNDKNLRIFIVHRSTDSSIVSDISLHSYTTLGFHSNTSFDYKVYELSVEVHDQTIHDGTTCVDYRNQNDTYGNCNYKSFINQIYSNYGCYPPWVSDETEDKLCEIGVKNKEINGELHKQIWKYLDMLTDGTKIDLMKQCLPSCYQIKTKLEKKSDYPFLLSNASLIINNAADTVKIFKAVYSFDIFTLTVELGSALGLWLGKVFFLMKKF